jgi:hypothetical protein
MLRLLRYIYEIQNLVLMVYWKRISPETYLLIQIHRRRLEQ